MEARDALCEKIKDVFHRLHEGVGQTPTDLVISEVAQLTLISGVHFVKRFSVLKLVRWRRVRCDFQGSCHLKQCLGYIHCINLTDPFKPNPSARLCFVPRGSQSKAYSETHTHTQVRLFLKLWKTDVPGIKIHRGKQNAITGKSNGIKKGERESV